MTERVFVHLQIEHDRCTHINVISWSKTGEQQSGKIKELHQDGHLKNNRLVSGKPYS